MLECCRHFLFAFVCGTHLRHIEVALRIVTQGFSKFQVAWLFSVSLRSLKILSLFVFGCVRLPFVGFCFRPLFVCGLFQFSLSYLAALLALIVLSCSGRAFRIVRAILAASGIVISWFSPVRCTLISCLECFWPADPYRNCLRWHRVRVSWLLGVLRAVGRVTVLLVFLFGHQVFAQPVGSRSAKARPDGPVLFPLSTHIGCRGHVCGR